MVLIQLVSTNHCQKYFIQDWFSLRPFLHGPENNTPLNSQAIWI